MAVDSSVIGVGFILLQVGEDGKRYPNWFGSLAWNEREKNVQNNQLINTENCSQSSYAQMDGTDDGGLR